MLPHDFLQDDPTIIEIGVRDALLASSMAQEDFSNCLGDSADAHRLNRLLRQHPE